jgi:hypothetical protein
LGRPPLPVKSQQDYTGGRTLHRLRVVIKWSYCQLVKEQQQCGSAVHGSQGTCCARGAAPLRAGRAGQAGGCRRAAHAHALAQEGGRGGGEKHAHKTSNTTTGRRAPKKWAAHSAHLLLLSLRGFLPRHPIQAAPALGSCPPAALSLSPKAPSLTPASKRGGGRLPQFRGAGQSRVQQACGPPSTRHPDTSPCTLKNQSHGRHQNGGCAAQAMPRRDAQTWACQAHDAYDLCRHAGPARGAGMLPPPPLSPGPLLSLKQHRAIQPAGERSRCRRRARPAGPGSARPQSPGPAQ